MLILVIQLERVDVISTALIILYFVLQRHRMKSRSPLKASQVPMCEDKLKIIIRIRPVLNEQDPNMFVSLEDNDTLEIRRPGNHSYMKFNNILPAESTQKDVFLLVEDSIRQFLKGINTTIFAYGQTGAGKTYSIIGNYSPEESHENLFNFLSSTERGILSRSLEMIMSIAAKEPKARFFVSFYQIYNEKIYDLYNNTSVGLDIRESKNGEISIPDLVTVQISKMQEAIQFLMIGLKNRATGSTQANAKSSRSHSIFQISMQKEDGDSTICSSLRIVDLAGSQKYKIPNDLSNAEKEIRIQELTSINGSLSCLGHCISALIDKSRTHIPFRNSKLTRILSDSLLGQGKMRFIICISPSISACAETFSTLQFANRAKRAIFDRNDHKSPSIQKKRSQTEEMIALKKELERQRERRIQMEKENVELKKHNELLKSQNGRLLNRMQVEGGSQKINKSSDKQSSIFSNINYYDKDKENGFKEEMLKLAIFQKTKISHLNPINTSPGKCVKQTPTIAHSRHTEIDNSPQVRQRTDYTPNNFTKATPINQKKAEFQKKIRKFIESDSPKTSKQHKTRYQEPSFEIESYHQPPIQIQQPKMILKDDSVEHHYSDEDIWNTNRVDTNQFIEKACTEMNLNEFKELKTEMDRARQELLNLKKKDNALQQRKVIIR